MKNPFSVDSCYIVSIKRLREICESLCDCEKRWWLEVERLGGYHPPSWDMVILNYNNPTGDMPNTISYAFPVVASLPLFDEQDGIMVCLYPLATIKMENGLYFEGAEIRRDDFTDWETFWFPLEAKLASFKKLS